MVITRVAAESPELVAALVYLCAFVPLAGDSLMALGRLDHESLLQRNVSLRPPSLRLRPGCARDVFYAQCAERDAAWAAAQLRPDPLLPVLQRLPQEPPPELRRGYIECTEDRAISLARQRAMAARARCDWVLSMRTDHSPFLSAPQELVEHLHGLAEGSA
jgi:hypothetical protein